MDKNCISCGSCGMPLEKTEDFALGDTSSVYCKYCTDEQGQLLSFDTILTGTTKFYVESQGVNEEAARKMAKALLLDMPAWRVKS